MVYRTSTFSLLATAVISIGTVGCRTRAFNPNASETRGAGDASAKLPVPVGVDAKLLTNLAAPVDNPTNDVTADAIVALPNGKLFATLRGSDGEPLGEIDTAASPLGKPWNVIEYEKILTKAAKADSKVTPPQPFAGAAVLNVLVKNRRNFARRSEGNVQNVPDALGERGMFESVSLAVSDFEISDPTRVFLRTTCGGYDPRDYSDVRWHYYCNVPGIFRACQRLLVGRFYDFKLPDLLKRHSREEFNNEQFAAAANRLRRDDEESVRSYCLDPSGFEDARAKDDYDSHIRSRELKLELPQGSFVRLFQKFHASQKDETTGVNMYDYIMRSGLYAWDFTQQQAVLNTFYGSLKLTGAKAFDPADPDDCSLFRDARRDALAWRGNSAAQCLVSAIRYEPFYVSPVGAR